MPNGFLAALSVSETGLSLQHCPAARRGLDLHRRHGHSCLAPWMNVQRAVRLTACCQGTGRVGATALPAVVIARVTIALTMRQAAVWPPVHFAQAPTPSLGCGRAE